MNESIKKSLVRWLVCGLLAAVTLAVYAPVAENNFINLDDPDYVMNNPHVRQGLTADAIHWAFFSFHSSNWHPLTWLSHALDCQLYGLNPMGHHLTNVAWHIANTVLLFLLLLNLTARLWSSAFVALLFAIHPMHVESVAWVAERKDVLSGFFFLLTLLAYARYVELTKAQDRRRWLVYGLTLLLFALGLMAKSMLVTLPCVLLLLDYWPLGRFQLPVKSQPFAVFRRLALEKVPFFLLTALSCGVTLVAQARGNAVLTAEAFPLTARLAHVPVAYGWYVCQLFWPAKLSVYYLLHVNHPFEEVAGTLVLLLAMTGCAVFLARKQPWFLFGWLWFLGLLVPVLGLVQVGVQAYANRYSYLPYIGLFIILAWGVPALLAKWRYRRPVLLIAAFLVSALCVNLTIAQIHLWKNAITLFQRAIALDDENLKAWDLLGLQYMNQGNVDKAIDCLRVATKRNPMFSNAWTSLGAILVVKGDFAGAQDAFQMALPYADDKTEVYNDLGDLFMKTGKDVEAAGSFQSSLELAPDQPEIHFKLGQCLLLNRQPDKAAVEFQNAIRLQPENADAELGLATILGDSGRGAEAITHYRRVIQLKADSVVALNNLAWLLATAADPRLRNGGEAVRLAERACKLTQYNQAFFIGTLAAAYAAAGKYNDAVNTAQKARDVALAHGQKEVAANNERLMEMYKSGRAFHDEAHPAP